MNNRHSQVAPSLGFNHEWRHSVLRFGRHLARCLSEKTLTGMLSRRRPWRIPIGATMWSLGFIGNLLRGRSVYDAARNRGHLALCNWETLRKYSNELVEKNCLKGSVLKHFSAWIGTEN